MNNVQQQSAETALLLEVSGKWKLNQSHVSVTSRNPSPSSSIRGGGGNERKQMTNFDQSPLKFLNQASKSAMKVEERRLSTAENVSNYSQIQSNIENLQSKIRGLEMAIRKPTASQEQLTVEATCEQDSSVADRTQVNVL